MRKLKLGILSLSLLGLMACGGEDGADGATNNRFDFQLTPLAAGERPWILLEGAQIEPKHLSFKIDRNYFDNGTVSETSSTNTTSTINEQINRQMQDWLDSINQVSDIEVSADITSSNTNVIAYENGKLVAIAPGKANLTITLDTSKPLSSVFDTSDIDFTGFQDTYEFGEVTVCPYVDVDLGIKSDNVNTLIQDAQAPLHAITYLPDTSDYSKGVFTSVKAYAEIDTDKLAAAGLTIEDCSTQTKLTNDFREVSPLIHNSVSIDALTAGEKFFTQSGVDLLGFNFPNVTMSRITSISNPQLTAVGYGGKLVLNALNPFTVEAQSSELGGTVDISHFYLSEDNKMNDYSFVLGLALVSDIDNCAATFCVNPADASYTIQLTHTELPNLSSEALLIKEGIADIKLNKITGLPGETFTVNTNLTVDGVVYDTSELFFLGHSGVDLTAAYFDNLSNGDNVSTIGNSFVVHKAHNGKLSQYTDDRIDINFITGDSTEQAIRGRWVQADTGEDHYIAAHSTFSYSNVSDNLITYQTSANQTATLLRAGIDNVTVSGSVNIVEEASAQVNSVQVSDSSTSPLARSFTPQARGLSGIGSIDLILKNVNTGDETEVTVDEAGNFNEEVPTGIYDVDGTVVDGGVTYAIETQITVERDATDTGKLNLAKVGLYNFDVSISGCEHDYKCYAGKTYTFTVTAKNTGLIAADGIFVTIGNGSTIDHSEVASSNVPASQVISGMDRGDTLNYTFTARFNTPLQDTVIDIPITLYDSANDRTWEDAVSIKLSQYPSRKVNIKAYNANALAEVRGYLMLEGRTPIRVDGTDSAITIPNKPGASYELIIANQEYSKSTPYGVANDVTLIPNDFSGFNDVNINESTDNTAAGAQAVNNGVKFISYISAGDVDHYTINIPEVQ